MKNSRKSLISLLLVLTMLIGCMGMMSVSGSAAIVTPPSDIETWDGTVATEYAGGTGTEADPYQISTAAQFAYFRSTEAANATAETYYVLTADLCFNGDSYANVLSGAAADFAGVLDGQGYTLYNPYMSTAKSALFGSVSGTVKNLNVDGVRSISGTWNTYMAGVVYTLSGTMENVHVTNGDVRGLGGGGLVYQTTGAVEVVINNCSYQGVLANQNATNNGSGFGGIVGNAATQTGHSLTVTDCYVNINATLTTTARIRFGGIVGTIGPEWVSGAPKSTALTIENCIAEGTVTHTGTSSNGSTGIGGILGISGTYVYNVTLKNCINKINLNCGVQKYVGGLVGELQAATAITVTDCANYGDVVGDNAGGLFGRVANKVPTVSNCANYGAVAGTTATGAITGLLNENMTLNGGVYYAAEGSAATLLFGTTSSTVTATSVTVVDASGATYTDLVDGITVYTDGTNDETVIAANVYANNNSLSPWIVGELAPEPLAVKLALSAANLTLRGELVMNMKMDASVLANLDPSLVNGVFVKTESGSWEGNLMTFDNDDPYYYVAVDGLTAETFSLLDTYYVVVIYNGVEYTAHEGTVYSPVRYAERMYADADAETKTVLESIIRYAYYAELNADGESNLLADFNAAVGSNLTEADLDALYNTDLVRGDVDASAMSGIATVGSFLGENLNLVFILDESVTGLTMQVAGETFTYTPEAGHIVIDDLHAGMVRAKLTLTFQTEGGEVTATYAISNYLNTVAENGETVAQQNLAKAAMLYMAAARDYAL